MGVIKPGHQDDLGRNSSMNWHRERKETGCSVEPVGRSHWGGNLENPT